jgi:hypothetical protein
MKDKVPVLVILRYDDASAKWEIVVTGCKDETEAKQAFNAAVMTLEDVVITLEHKTTPALVAGDVCIEGYGIEPATTLRGLLRSGIKTK